MESFISVIQQVIISRHPCPGPDEHVPRLRAARRISFSWVETRLRAEAQGDILVSRGVAQTNTLVGGFGGDTQRLSKIIKLEQFCWMIDDAYIT